MIIVTIVNVITCDRGIVVIEANVFVFFSILKYLGERHIFT